jgi:hypothetical protein
MQPGPGRPAIVASLAQQKSGELLARPAQLSTSSSGARTRSLGDCQEFPARLGGSTCRAIGRMNRTSKRTANWALAMHHSCGRHDPLLLAAVQDQEEQLDRRLIASLGSGGQSAAFNHSPGLGYRSMEHGGRRAARSARDRATLLRLPVPGYGAFSLKATIAASGGTDGDRALPFRFITDRNVGSPRIVPGHLDSNGGRCYSRRVSQYVSDEF